MDGRSQGSRSRETFQDRGKKVNVRSPVKIEAKGFLSKIL